MNFEIGEKVQVHFTVHSGWRIAEIFAIVEAGESYQIVYSKLDPGHEFKLQRYRGTGIRDHKSYLVKIASNQGKDLAKKYKIYHPLVCKIKKI